MTVSTAAAASREPLKACDRALADHYDVALLDLDGVIYRGELAVQGAAPALASARERGMHLAFVTNNAARPPEVVAAHLTELGVPAAPHEVVTSAQAAAAVLGGLVPAGSSVLVVGGTGLVLAVEEAGFVAVSSADDKPAAVVQGFGPHTGWRQLAEAAIALAEGIPWVASNTDLTVPVARGIAPGNGSFVEVLRLTTGRSPDIVAGKPHLPLMQASLKRTSAARPLVVGDRLDTDIEGAVRAGVDSLLVFTGVARPRDAVLAPAGARPTYLSADLAGLLAPHPPVRLAQRGSYECGGWTASVDGAALRLQGTGDPYDGLRASCAAGWAVADARGPHAVELDVSAMESLGLA